MPYRRRKRSRKDWEARQLRFRTGNIPSSGKGKPFTPNSKTFFARCSGTYMSGGTLAGDVAVMNCLDYNIPIALEGNETFAHAGPTADAHRHPTGHADSIAQGYDTATIKSSMYRFTVSYKGTNSNTKDFAFCYKFTNDADVSDEIVFTAGDTTESHWNDIRMSRGWVVKQFSSSNSGGSIWPAAAVIDVKIPSAAKLAYGLNKSDVSQNENNPFRHAITDTSTATVFQVPCFLIIMVICTGGVAFTLGDVNIDVDWFGKVMVERDIDDESMIKDLDTGP